MIADGYRLLSPHMRGVRWWLPRIFRGAAILLAVVFGIIALFAVIGPRFGYTYAVVKSGSMAPAYPVGSVIVIDALNPNAVEVDDVISFRTPANARDEIVTHRVIGVVREGGTLQFQTKGDANDVPDGTLIPASAVKGRVIFGLPWVGWLAPIAQTKGLFLGVVVACGSLLILQELLNIVRELRKSKESRVDSST